MASTGNRTPGTAERARRVAQRNAGTRETPHGRGPLLSAVLTNNHSSLPRQPERIQRDDGAGQAIWLPVAQSHFPRPRRAGLTSGGDSAQKGPPAKRTRAMAGSGSASSLGCPRARFRGCSRDRGWAREPAPLRGLDRAHGGGARRCPAHRDRPTARWCLGGAAPAHLRQIASARIFRQGLTLRGCRKHRFGASNGLTCHPAATRMVPNMFSPEYGLGMANRAISPWRRGNCGSRRARPRGCVDPSGRRNAHDRSPPSIRENGDPSVLRSCTRARVHGEVATSSGNRLRHRRIRYGRSPHRR